MHEEINQFVNTVCASKSLSAHTRKAYLNDLLYMHKFFGARRDVRALSGEDIQALLTHMLHGDGFKNTTVKRRMATVKQFFRWLHKMRTLRANPLEGWDIRIRLPRCLPKSLTLHESRQICETLTHAAAMPCAYRASVLQFCVLFMLITGIRVGELVALSVQDINDREMFAIINGKGSRQRKVYFPGEQMERALRDLLARRKSLACADDKLLVFENGTHISAQYLRRKLKNIAQRAGIRRTITPHMLRHTAATQLIEAGVDIRFVQKLLGHTSIVTTQIYTHVSDESLRSVMEKACISSKLSIQ